MNNQTPYIKYLIYFFIGYINLVTGLIAQEKNGRFTLPKVISRVVSLNQPKLYKSLYVQKDGVCMRSGDFISGDNGKTWLRAPMKPDFLSGLPYGYRREPMTSVLDTHTGRIITIVNALDIRKLDPRISEPTIAQKTYYLRYRVSEDSGKTWLFDDPIVQSGKFKKKHPFERIFIGRNSIYLGDIGSLPVITKDQKILIPAQTTPLDVNGKLYNPGDGYTYTDVVVLIGKWANKGKIEWKMSDRIKGDPLHSTRGMIEPTLLEMEDGRLLIIMRGSNEKNGANDYRLPSYKWYSISKDGGQTWSAPAPLTFEDGGTFYSPSSMSVLFKHSSGRCFWIGNMTEANSKGDLPRWPLVFVELNSKNLKLIRENMLIVDTHEKEDSSRGRLDISHISIIEDRETNDIILTYPRFYDAYRSKEWVTVRIAVK
jgi:hypothetical protein